MKEIKVKSLLDVPDKLHRTNGPAIIWNNVRKFYFIDGKEYSEGAFECLIKNKDRSNKDGKK